MNKIHSLVWNDATGAWVPAAEGVRARSKRSGSGGGARSRLPGLAAALVAAGLFGAPAVQAQSGSPAPVAAGALPTGGQVVGGQASLHSAGNTLTVQQGSARAAIDWATFNVGRDAQVNFVQPSAQSVTLNRVQDGNPSQIFGRITANGQVFLSNPGGVYFAPGASVDVGGLVATTHRIALDDFMAGRVKFERNGATGSVVNEGELRAALGGYIALLAPEVRNQGVVLAHLGTVALAAGEAFELQFDGNNTLASLRVTPGTVKALVDNRSAVLAPGGLVILSAQALDKVQGGVVKNSGRIEATGLAQRGGRIVLEASDRIDNSGQINASATAEGPAGQVRLQAPELANSGQISATGSAQHPEGGRIEILAGQLLQSAAGLLDVSAPRTGGSVQIQASGAVSLGGTLRVAATQDVLPAESEAAPDFVGPPAPERASSGGEIQVQAAQITLDSATLDASGGQGGRITLDASGAAAASTGLPTSPAPQPAPEPGHVALLGNTQLSSRGRRGPGGSLTLLGDDIGLNDQSLLDASGAAGGGTVRVGGGWQGGEGLYQARRVQMGADARIDASATEHGGGGTVVLWSDVGADGSHTAVQGTVTARGGAAGGDGGQVETSGHTVDIDGARVNAGADAGQGGLWLIDPFNYTIGAAQASAIAGNASSGLNSGTSVTVTTTANASNYGSSGNSGQAGNIQVDSPISKTSGGQATLTLQAEGSITFGSGSGVASSVGKLNLVLIADYDSAGAGAIYLNGSSFSTNGGHVWIGGNGYAAGNTTTTWNGLQVGTGVANSNNDTPLYEGVRLNATTIATGGGAVYIAGRSARISNPPRYGVVIDSGSNISTGAGSISISGSVQPVTNGSSDSLEVVGLRLDNSRLSTTSGAISLTGSISGGMQSGNALNLRNNSTISSTSGSITLRGTADNVSNSPTEGVFGVYLHNKVTVSSDSGAINLYGTANAKSNTGAGIWLGSTSSSGSTGDGNASSGVGNGYNVAVVSNSGNVLIDARGVSTATTSWFHGFTVIAYQSDKHLLKTTSGNITIKGDANVNKDDSSGVQFQVNTANGNIHVVSSSGDIYMQGYQHSGSTAEANNALRFTPGNSVGSIRFGALSDDASSYTGRITFEADSIWNNTNNAGSLGGAVKAVGAGAISFQSTASASVKDFVLTSFWNFGTAHSSFAIGKATEDKTITLGANIVAAGPITVYGGNIVLNGDLTSTLSGAGIRLLASGSIRSTAAANTTLSLDTNAGDVVLAGDTDGNADGNIDFSAQSLSIDTRVGTGGGNTGTSGGGGITLGGGNLQGTGYASGWGADDAEGIRARGMTLTSGGGDIQLRGRSWVGTLATGGHGAWGVGTWGGDLNIDSGLGRIRIEGVGRSTSTGSYQQGIVANGKVNIRSAYAGADAITLIGSSSNTGSSIYRAGIDLGANNPQTAVDQHLIYATGVGGGITIQGQGPTGAVALRSGSQILANGGDIKLVGTATSGAAGIALTVDANAPIVFGSRSGTPVTASSSKLLLEFDTFTLNNARPQIATTGQVTLRSASASFASTLNTSWFNWNQYGQTMTGLTLGKVSNTGAGILINGSNGSSATAVVVNGPLTAYGSTVELSSALTVTGSGNIYLEAFQNADPSIQVTGEISKTGGGDATLTMKAAGRINAYGGISASGAGTGKLNLVFWADSDANRVGGAAFSASRGYTTNGGHIWIGGSATPGGSTTWNGLTVGNGASAGSYSANHNGIDLNGTFTTAGGDFYAAGKTYVTGAPDISPTGSGAALTVNTGSGNVTFVGSNIYFGRSDNQATTAVNSTGTLTIQPWDDSFSSEFKVQGSLVGNHWVGSGNKTGTANLSIQNAASLGGLVIGKESNSQAITVASSLSIAGDISLYGGRIANSGGASLTSTAGSILLDADLGRGLDFSGRGIEWTGGGLTALSSAAGRGRISLFGRGGSKAGSNQGVFLSGTTLSAGGDVRVEGLAPAQQNTALYVDENTHIQAGGTLTLQGSNLAVVSSLNNRGVLLANGVSLSSAGALRVSGRNGPGSSNAVELQNGVSLSTSGADGDIQLTALDGGGIGSASGGNSALSSISANGGGDITLTADRLAFDASRPLALSTTGMLSFEPYSSSYSNSFLWSGSTLGGNFLGNGSLAHVRINQVAQLGGLTVGKAGNGSAILVDAAMRAAGPIRLFGQTLSIDAEIDASGNAQQEDNRIELHASGNVVQTAALKAHGLSLQGGGRFVLDHAGNDVAVLAAGSANAPLSRLSYVDANGLAIGSVGAISGLNASGKISVETLAGNLHLGASVASASTAGDAIVLNAGRNKQVSDADFFSGAGGSLSVANGVAVTVGSGGRATLYSGQVVASTGLADLVGAGSGHFRYASDEATQNYVSPLGSGVYAVYREQPTITLRGIDQSLVYGNEAALAVGASGLLNGDTVDQGLGRLPTATLMAGGQAASRSAAGHVNVRRDGAGSVIGYGMLLSRNAASDLGYAIAYDDGGLTTVTPGALSAVINDDAKFVGLADNPGYAGATLSGFARGESAADVDLSATITRSVAGEAVGRYDGALTASLSVASGNYVLDPARVTAGSFHIVDPSTLIVRVGSASAVYGDAAAYDVAQVRYFDSAAGIERSLTQGSSEFHWTLGGNSAQAVNLSLASAGLNVGVHAITGTLSSPATVPNGAAGLPDQVLAIGGQLSITPRTLSVSATKVYDGSDALLPGQVSLGNLVGGETLTVADGRLSDRNVTTDYKYLSQLGLADGSGLASNYQLPSLAAYDAQANSATVTPRALGVVVDKVYDGLASASAAQTTLSNLAPGEALALLAVGLSDAHVATAGKHVSTLSLGDSGAYRVSNYSLPSLTAAGAGNQVQITPQSLQVRVDSASGASKVYDGSTAVDGGFTAILQVSGYVGGDTGSVNYSALYDSKTVDARRIQLGSLSLAGLISALGSQASDYQLDGSAAFTPGSITSRQVSAASAAGPVKVYDGSTSVAGAQVSLAVATATTGRVAGDDLGILAVGGSFNGADAGANRSYTLADITLNGADARNYVLSSGTISGSDGLITPRPLTLGATQVYSGSASLGNLVLGNLAPGEYLLVSAASAQSAHVAGPDGNTATVDNFVRTLTLANVLDGATPIYKTSNYSLPGSSSGVVTGVASTLNAAAGNSVSITPAPLALSLADTLVSKVYDGSTAAAAGYQPQVQFDGLVAGDTGAVLAFSGAFDAASVAGASQFTLSGLGLSSVSGGNGSQGSDYQLGASSLSVAGSISARALAVDVASGIRKTYDASTGFEHLAIGLTGVSGDSASGLIGTDAGLVAVVAGGGGFDSANAGSGKSYTLTGLTLSGSAAGNYALVSGDSLSGIDGIVTPKLLSLQGMAPVTKVYDGSTAASTTVSGSLGWVAVGNGAADDGRAYVGDDLALGGSASAASFNSANVAEANRVSYSGYSLTGAAAANYTLEVTASGSITPKALGVTTTLAAKTYDGSTALTVQSSTLSGLVGSQTLVLGSSAVLDDAHAGSRTATLSYTVADGANGGQAGNYSLASTATQAVTVARQVLTVQGSSVAGKTYDGSNAASLSLGNLSGLLAGESLQLAGSAVFDSANAGLRSATVSYTLANAASGAGLASDYLLADDTLSATIAQRTLTLSASKVYDGGLLLGAGAVQLGNLVDGESLGYSGAMGSGTHVATTGKYISALSLLDGAGGTGLASNYRLPTLNAANAPLAITPKALTASAAITGSASKVYDGSRAANGAAVTGTVLGAVAGDVLGLDVSGISLAYDTAHVATASEIAASGQAVLAIASSGAGSQASDYSFTAPAIAAVPAQITPATLTATLANTGVTKVYDGQTTAPAGFVPQWQVAGLVAGDSATLTHDPAAYDSANVLQASALGLQNLALAAVNGAPGSQLSDYQLLGTSASVAAAVTPRTVSITGLQVAGKTYDGTDEAELVHWGQVSGTVGGQTLGLAGNDVRFSDAQAGNAKAVLATGYALSDGTGAQAGLASNYQLASTSASTTADVARALLTVWANNDAKFVTQSDAGGYAGVSFSGFVNGETAAVLGGAATVSRSNAPVQAAGQYDGVLQADVSGLSSPNYQFQVQAGDYSIVPSHQLLVRVQAGSNAYGTAATYQIQSAEYFDGHSVVSLNGITALGGQAFVVDDGAGGSARFNLVALDATLSGAGHTVVGSYQLGASGVQTLNAQNFSDTLTVVGQHSVLARAVSASPTAGPSKVYDGSTAIGGISLALQGVAAGDAVGAEGLGAYASPNAGTGLAYSVTGLALLGADAGNYYLGSTRYNGQDGVITPRTLTLSASKVYDGSTALGDGTVQLGNLVAGESLGYAGAAASDAHVVTAGKHLVALTLLDGNGGTGLAGNYQLPTLDALNAPVQIAPRTVTATAGSASANSPSKVYDGQTSLPSDLVLQWTLSGLVAGDSLAIAHTGAAYDSANVLQASRITFSGLSLAGTPSGPWGSQAGDYLLLNDSSSLAAAITPRSVSLSAAKVYDSLNTLGQGQVQIGNLVAGESLGYSGATASDANVATVGKHIATLTLLDGSANGSGLVSNYQLPTLDAAHAPVDISPRDLVVGYSGVDKVYDGHLNASVLTTDDRIAGDRFSLLPQAAFEDKNVGTGKTVWITDLQLSGPEAANYRVVRTSGDTLASTQASITRLDQVQWVGPANGDWFDPANWAGGAVPDLANVANVLIPEGVTVRFDPASAQAPAQAGPVQIERLGEGGQLVQDDGTLAVGGGGVTLGGLTQHGGTLSSAGDVNLGEFSQTGGSTRTQGDLVVNGGFHQGPGGTLQVQGDARIDSPQDGVTLGQLHVGGDVVVNSPGGDITQSPGTTLQIGGTTTLDAGAHDIRLDNVGNDFGGPVNATGHDIALRDDEGGLVLGDVEASGEMRATSGDGAITQSPGSTVHVEGATTLDAGTHDVRLDNPGNDFGGPVNASGHDIALRDDEGGLVLGDVEASGEMRATSSDGAITQSPGTTLQVDGGTTLDAGTHDVRLDNAGNDFGGPVNARGDDVALRDDAGGLVLGDVQAGGQLKAASHGGAITQNPGSALQVTGSATLDAGTHDVRLDNAGNDFGGPVNATGHDVTLRDDTGGLVLGEVKAGGQLTAHSQGGAISQSPGSNLQVAGDLRLDAGGAPVRLNPGNQVGGTVRLGEGGAVLPQADLLPPVQVPAPLPTPGNAPPPLAEPGQGAAAAPSATPGSAGSAGSADAANGQWLQPAGMDGAPAMDGGAEPGTDGASFSRPVGESGRAEGGGGLILQVLRAVSAQQAGWLSVQVPAASLAQGFSFSLPPQLLPEGLLPENLVATLEDGRPLPAWLRFEPAERRFIAERVPAGALPLRALLRFGAQSVLVEISVQAD